MLSDVELGFGKLSVGMVRGQGPLSIFCLWTHPDVPPPLYRRTCHSGSYCQAEIVFRRTHSLVVSSDSRTLLASYTVDSIPLLCVSADTQNSLSKLLASSPLLSHLSGLKVHNFPNLPPSIVLLHLELVGANSSVFIRIDSLDKTRGFAMAHRNTGMVQAAFIHP